MAALAFSGLVNAAFLLGAEGSRVLPSSPWRLLLIGKLGLFLVPIWLAARPATP